MLSYLMFVLLSADPAAAPSKTWVFLTKQGVFGYGYQLQDGPHKGKWKIDPGSKRYPAPAPAVPPDHRQAFLTFLNGWRAQHGLPPCGYSGDLEGWAAANNAQQRAMGMGHHVMGPARRQNAAMGTNDPAPMWVASAAHNSALLDSSITTIGLAWDGTYWTFNAN